MKHDLDADIRRVNDIWQKWQADQAYPDMALFAMITDLRKYDKGIDYPLRRILNSDKYRRCVRTYGAPPSKYPRYPFRWNDRIWALIRVRPQFCEDTDKETK